MKNTTEKNFVVNIKQGQLTGQYLFLNFTKKQVIAHILAQNLFGESLDSISINELGIAENGVAFIGSTKDMVES